MICFASRLLRAVAWAPVIGLIVTLGTASAVRAGPGEMTFRPVAARECGHECPALFIAEGRITDETSQQFRNLVTRVSPRRTVVFLNSRGGTLPGGILLGQAFRQHGAAVMVPRGAVCESACAYALLGGVTRVVDRGGRVGLHRFFAVSAESGRRSGDAIAYERAITPTANALLRNYIAQMGANPRLVAVAAAAGPSTMRYLSRDELRRYRVVTATVPR